MDDEGGRWVFPVLAIVLPMITSLGLVGWGFGAGYLWGQGKRGLAAALVATAVLVVMGMAGMTAFAVFGVSFR